MPYGQHDHHYGGSSGTGTATPEPVTTRPVPHGCCKPDPEPVTCCDLVCFERPRYFCGHLLKDTDLSKAQEYVIEKHKLYHRSLHGHGIVCGLRLTCDAACCGYIRIDEGYAIDDCGNDIVVCERARFDVLARLKEKGLLIPTPPKDPCDKYKEPSPCPVRQCFYVVVCYQETEHDFTSPLTPGCGPSPKDCEATRIRETYAFDVVDRRPPSTSPLDALKERLECCFSLFADDPFGKTLDEVRRVVCRDPYDTTGADSYWVASYDKLHELYCRLRGLLLLYLKKHPDQYNCRIEQDILEINFPTTYEVQNGTSVEPAFCRLIELAYNHSLSCFFGALAFPCPEPAQASCVVLGTVEVEDGCVVRVCNCPRDYVWSFSSFFQVLASTLFGSIACETVEAPEHRKKAEPDCGYKKGDPTQTCCRTFEIDDCCKFLTAMGSVGRSSGDVVVALLNGVDRVKEATQRAFDPRRWDSLSSSAFIGRYLRDLPEDPYLKNVAIQQCLDRFPPEDDPIAAFARSLLPGRSDRFEVEIDKSGLIVDARPVPELYARVSQLEQELVALKKSLGPNAAPPPEESRGPGGRGGKGGRTKS